MWEVIKAALRTLTGDSAKLREELRKILVVASMLTAKTATKIDDTAVKILMLVVESDTLWKLIEPILPKIMDGSANKGDVEAVATAVAVQSGEDCYEVAKALNSLSV